MRRFGRSAADVRRDRMKEPACQQLLRAYTSERVVGSGRFGMTTLRKRADGGEDVVKRSDFHQDYEPANFDTEKQASQVAAEAGVGPRIRFGADCSSYGLLAMEPLDRLGDVSVREVDALMDTVQRMHEAGIWHSDLYTRNLMRSKGAFRVIDYGMAYVFPGPVPMPLRYCDIVGLFLGENYDDAMRDGLVGTWRGSRPKSSGRWLEAMRKAMRRLHGFYDQRLMAWAVRVKCYSRGMRDPHLRAMWQAGAEYLEQQWGPALGHTAKVQLITNPRLTRGFWFLGEQGPVPIPEHWRRVEAAHRR